MGHIAGSQITDAAIISAPGLSGELDVQALVRTSASAQGASITTLASPRESVYSK